MHHIDVAALNKSFAAYKKLSLHAAAEVAAMHLKHGWRAAAFFACRRCQQIALGLQSGELAPCELTANSPFADPRIDTGLQLRRGEMVMMVRQLKHLGLSKYEPSPLRAIEAEERRRAETSKLLGRLIWG
jgi:hypothetical protein